METNGQKAAINILYIMLTAVTVFACMPSVNMQILAAFLSIIFLGSAYIYKARDLKDGLISNHMTYMIGTFWASSTIFILSALLAGFFVFMNGDNSSIDSIFQSIEGGNMDVNTIISSGMASYTETNKTLLLASNYITYGPTILYFVYRVANGYSRAMKGYRIANPKSWL